MSLFMNLALLLNCLLRSRASSYDESLVGPDVLGSYRPRHERAHEEFVHVDDPAAGFFIAGSSVRELHGLYSRVEDETTFERVTSSLGHEVLLAYEHEQTGLDSQAPLRVSLSISLSVSAW